MIDTNVTDLKEVMLTLLTFRHHGIGSQVYDTQKCSLVVLCASIVGLVLTHVYYFG